jgi:hypothetical protein
MRTTLAAAFVAVTLAAAPAAAQRTSVARDFPFYPNAGKPDLTPDPQRFVSQMQIVDRLFHADDCAVIEGAVGGTGYRRLLRFDTVIINAGGGDLVVGNRADPDNPYADWFYFSPCHGHHHLRGFADYLLLGAGGATVVAGHKQGFCMLDSLKYGGGESNGYDCEFQGITLGWGDWYDKHLDGQWIDITGVPEGDYVVRMVINAAGTFDEGENRHPNVVETTLHVPDPRKKVTIVP